MEVIFLNIYSYDNGDGGEAINAQLSSPEGVAVPAEIGNLTSLTNLELAANELTGSIPVEIGNLTSLSYLYLYDNQLTSIPAERVRFFCAAKKRNPTFTCRIEKS